MKARWMLLVAGLAVMALAPGAFASCWCGNGYSDPSSNLLEGQVWPGDLDGLGTSTWMDFTYTTDGSDPTTSGTAVVVSGTFLKFQDNNDWYQAYATADDGDLVRWFITAQSADGDICVSDVIYEYISGYTPPVYPNLVGDIESELGLGGDWNNGDAASDLAVEGPPGVFSVTLTATADFTYGSGAGYQIVGASGSWSPQYPGDGNIHIGFTTGETITFYLDTNSQPGWAPDANAPYDSKLISETHTWAAVGDWQGWDPANPETQMTDAGGGVYVLVYNFDASHVGNTYQFKAAADGGWDLQVGTNGYSSNGSTWYFDVTDAGCIGFFVDTNTGRIMVDYATGPSAAESETWGGIKQNYR
jgi:hypothetical protein